MSVEKAKALLELQPTGKMGTNEFLMYMGPWIVKVLQFLLTEYIYEQRRKRKVM